MTNDDAIKAWAEAADRVADVGDEGDFTRQHLLNPAIFALLGELTGKRVLDAGCGQGYLCRLLAKQGAIVTGVEPAGPWYRYAVQREEGERLGITYIQEDLSTLRDMQHAFDAAVANMVFMDIPNYEAAIHNCVASLVRGGDFVFSLVHPCFEEPSAQWGQKGFVAVKEYLNDYTTQQAFAPLYHRPLSRYLNLVVQEGCNLRQIIEPQLGAEWARHGPAYERNVHVPSVIVVHATRT